MSEVVNLRLARKRVARKAKEAAAEQNRIDSSIPARLRRKAEELRRLERERFEAGRIERPRGEG